MFWPLAVDRTRLDIVWFAADWGDGELPGKDVWQKRLDRFDVLMDEEANAEFSAFVADKIRQRVKDPAVAEKLASIGMDTTTSATPEDFARMLQDELKRWPEVVKAAGIQAE